MACDLLYSEYTDIGNQTSTIALAQLMGIFHKQKYQRHELWSKFEAILSAIYDTETNQGDENPVFSKDNVLVILKLVTERRMINGKLWELLHRDIQRLVQNGEIQLKELSLIMDCFYKSGVTSAEFS